MFLGKAVGGFEFVDDQAIAQRDCFDMKAFATQMAVV